MTQYLGKRQYSDSGVMEVSTDTPSGAIFAGPQALTAAGVAYLEDLGSDLVPATAYFRDGLAFNSNGALYVTSDAVSGAKIIGGFAVRADGAVYATTDAPTRTLGGIGVTESGQISVNGLADVDAPTYSSSAVEEATPTVIEVTFSEAVNSPGADYSAGVAIEVNGSGATISTAVRQSDQSVVFYTISSRAYSGDTVTWAYTAASGDIEDQAASPNALGNVSAQTVTNNTTTATPLLLDTYTAKIAVSLRKLRTAYAGAAVRVRESDGDTEADIGFSDGGLDTTALLAHTGANNGRIPTWYDQAASNNITQSTAADQPKIVSSGSVLTLNSLPALETKTTNEYLQTSGNPALATQPFVIYAVTDLISTASTRYLVLDDNSGDDVLVYIFGGDWYFQTSSSKIASAADTNTHLFDILFNGASSTFIDNGSTVGSGDVGSSALVGLTYGANTTGSNGIDARTGEIIVVDSASDRAAIRSNINSYYSVF